MGKATTVTSTTIHLDEGDDRRLAELAARRGTSCAALILEAIQHLLATEGASTRRPRPLGRSGHADISERVDELLAGLGDREVAIQDFLAADPMPVDDWATMKRGMRGSPSEPTD